MAATGVDCRQRAFLRDCLCGGNPLWLQLCCRFATLGTRVPAAEQQSGPATSSLCLSCRRVWFGHSSLAALSKELRGVGVCVVQTLGREAVARASAILLVTTTAKCRQSHFRVGRHAHERRCKVNAYLQVKRARDAVWPSPTRVEPRRVKAEPEGRVPRVKCWRAHTKSLGRNSTRSRSAHAVLSVEHAL